MSSRSIADLRPVFATRAIAWLDECRHAGLDVLITCTFRSMSEQNDLYAQGRTRPGKRVTNAKPGESAHNFRFALDFVPIVQGKPDWSSKSPQWLQLGRLAEACGLEWGGRWRGLVDLPHIQLPNWRTYVH